MDKVRDDYDDSGRIPHEAMRPARSDMIAEVVFARRWRELMATVPSYASMNDEDEPMLSSILCYLGEPNARDAQVAASFVTWLGTPVGGSVLIQADRLRPILFQSTSSFQVGPVAVAWLEENRRRTSVNLGYRSIELFLSPVDAPRGWMDLPFSAPMLSIRDYETVERVAAWLDEEEGVAFLDGAQREIAEFHEAKRKARRAQYAIPS